MDAAKVLRCSQTRSEFVNQRLARLPVHRFIIGASVCHFKQRCYNWPTLTKGVHILPFYTAKHDIDKCQQCGACRQVVACPGYSEEICLGCGACVLVCPSHALELVEDPRLSKVVLEVDGETVEVPERITVRDALAYLGYPMATMADESGLFAPCEVGACWSCALQVNGEVKPACKVGVKEGMIIDTKTPSDYVPLRLVDGFAGHSAGGVGTPWQLKGKRPYAEAVCFASGCNLRCPQCQNWHIAHRGQGKALTPKRAAQNLTIVRQTIGVDRMVISGGECTLNRPWLLQFLAELKKLNPDAKARFHIDTNGSLLTHGYIDELVDAGMTDVGIDLKAEEVFTFTRITGLTHQELARKYMETAWEAVKYCLSKYAGKLFVGVGIPYNKELTSIEEIARIGKRLADIDAAAQVTVLNYRPVFRSRISMPPDDEVEGIGQILRTTGLKTVICQTTRGFTGP
jgi:pyruvate formate lyase activating enzyme